MLFPAQSSVVQPLAVHLRGLGESGLAITALELPLCTSCIVKSFRSHSFRALSGRLEFTVRRHKFYRDSLLFTRFPDVTVFLAKRQFDAGRAAGVPHSQESAFP